MPAMLPPDSVPAVARLILLNGPPGIGKSTLAQRYVDDHPGVLNLDVDQVRTFVGGWRERFEETGEIVRPMAHGMAATHLRGGRDVIMPQYLGNLAEIESFEAVAHEQGAGFREIVLFDGRDNSLGRFSRRGYGDQRPWHRQVQDIVERQGGNAMLAAMHDQLVDVLRTRPEATVLPSTEGEIERTYQALLAALAV
jgi:predicted kinase